MKAVNVVKTAIWLAFLTGVSAAGIKYVAVVETGIDERSGAATEITSAEVALVTAELRREAVNNLPRDRFSVMTSETVQSMGGAVLEECSEENCVITLGSRIGADYIVRGTISKFQTKFTLTVEIYETDNGTLVGFSEPVRSEKAPELLELSGAACAEMFRKFAAAQNPIKQSLTTPQPEPTPPAAYTVAVNVNPANSGAVTRNPDKEAYTAGEKVTVTAKSADGYKFIDWTGAVTSRKNRATVTMDGDKTLTANFYKKAVAAAAPEDTASKVFAGYDDDGEPIYRKKRIKWTEEDYRADSAKNILTADKIPLIRSVFTWALNDCGSFGLGLQYERRLYRKFSLVGRYDYFGIWDLHDNSPRDESENHYYGHYKDWSSHFHSFETRARYYPTGKIFFLDGMLGYNVNTISGDYFSRNSEDDHYSSGTYDYFKWGALFGWFVRSPRKTSRFTYEVSFGWNFAINSNYKSVYYDDWGVIDFGLLDVYNAGWGAAGPRFVSAFGWRF